MVIVKPDLKEKIRNHLLWDDRLVTDGIDIEILEGTVKLNGTVPTFNQKLLVQEDIASIPGVERIENYLGITYPETTTSLTDDEIKKSIEDMLILDSRIDANNIKVSVDSGEVSLFGTVSAFWQKKLAEEHVLHLRGVYDLANHLIVVPTKSLQDEFIATDIKSALERNNIVNDEAITVEVAKGVVTLRGTVSSSISKRVAREISSYTGGVTNVIDQVLVG